MNTRAMLLGIVVTVMTGCATVQPPLHDPEYAVTTPVADPVPAPNSGAIFQPNGGMALFEDIKAREVGDLLTIELVEQTQASKSANTSTSKSQDIDIAGPTIFGRPVLKGGVEVLETQVSADRDFEGDGESSQSNRLSGSITVTVAQVLPNGNLIVRGEKVLSLNQGDEFIRVSGIVRPEDISPDNVVESPKLANARIIYGGRGSVADSNRMGWLARFFQSVVFPF